MPNHCTTKTTSKYPYHQDIPVSELELVEELAESCWVDGTPWYQSSGMVPARCTSSVTTWSMSALKWRRAARTASTSNPIDTIWLTISSDTGGGEAVAAADCSSAGLSCNNYSHTDILIYCKLVVYSRHINMWAVKHTKTDACVLL